MNRLVLGAAALMLAASLAACGKTEGSAPPPTAATADAAATMSDMALAGAAKTGTGTGTVTAVDPAAGAVTLAHGPIPELNWPAMTMAFKASPAILSQVKPGDQVAFDVNLQGATAELAAIRKP